MTTINTVNKKKVLMRFTAFYVLAIILIALILFSFLTVPIEVSQKVSSDSIARSAREINIDSIDNILHNSSNELLQLQSGQRMNDSASAIAIDGEVLAAQQRLQGTIDSISTSYRTTHNETEKMAINDLLSHFRSILNTSRALSSRESIPVGINSSKNTQFIKQLQQSLQIKDGRIVELQNQLRMGASNKGVIDNEQLQKQLLQNEKLAKANNNLKREIEVLNKRIDALKKFNAGT